MTLTLNASNAYLSGAIAGGAGIGFRIEYVSDIIYISEE